MAFNVNYNAGGTVDRVKVLDLLKKLEEIVLIDEIMTVDEVKKIHLPAGIFPDENKLQNFNKGFRLEIPASSGVYSESFLVPWDCHLIAAALVCSGYFDGDYWELVINPPTSTPTSYKRIETNYTKELPESIKMDESYPVIPQGTEIRFDFYNQSGTSKTVWNNLKFLY